MEYNTYQILRDSREKKPWIFKEDKECLGTTVTKLNTGDYTLEGYEDQFVIERKSGSAELVQNIYEDRFKDVLERLQQYKYRYIICDCSFDDICSFPIGSSIPKYLWHKVKASKDYLLNCITKWQVVYSIPIIWGGNNSDIIAKKLFHYIIKYVEKTKV